MLAAAGGLADTSAGWKSYADYLAWQATDGPLGKSQAFVSLSKGWALGSAEFKAALVKDHALAARARAWETQGAQEVRLEQWGAELTRCLRRLGKKPEDAAAERKSAPWKIAIACHLKQRTQASNRWLCDALQMGTPVGVSQLVGQFRRHGGPPTVYLKQLTEKPKT